MIKMVPGHLKWNLLATVHFLCFHVKIESREKTQTFVSHKSTEKRKEEENVQIERDGCFGRKRSETTFLGAQLEAWGHSGLSAVDLHPFSNLGPKMSQKVGAEAVLLKYLSQHPAKVFMFGYHPKF